MAMQTRIEKTFAIAASADPAWQVLQDIKTVAECMPGAQITEQVDATHYKGQVKLRLGPASATFNGELEIKSLAPLSTRLEMTGKGSDIGGTSAAAMDLTAAERAPGTATCALAGASDINERGKFASYGGGMTESSKALAALFDCALIRLQCYDGLDAGTAVYDWNYQRQLLAIMIRESDESSADEKKRHIFSKDFLLERPLLRAISQATAPVLLVDEIDRADEEFEAYLLELLSDFQISIPELGTIKATTIPYVVLTSNGTRELSDALRRRCLYHYIDYPSMAKEL